VEGKDQSQILIVAQRPMRIKVIAWWFANRRLWSAMKEGAYAFAPAIVEMRCSRNFLAKTKTPNRTFHLCQANKQTLKNNVESKFKISAAPCKAGVHSAGIRLRAPCPPDFFLSFFRRS
jgi:hypothetical protein